MRSNEHDLSEHSVPLPHTSIVQNRLEYSTLQDQQSCPSEFDTYILVSKQYGIGNAKSFVIIFENGSFVTPFLMLWDNSGLVVTMSRSEGKASEP